MIISRWWLTSLLFSMFLTFFLLSYTLEASAPPYIPYIQSSPPPSFQNSDPPPPSPSDVNNTWTTGGSSVNYTDGSKVWKVCTTREPTPSTISGPFFGCGLYCNGECTDFLFVVYSVPGNDTDLVSNISPWIVWSANRNNPAKQRASLLFTVDGNLQLSDINGVLWSSNTAGRSAARFQLTSMGNLKLVDANGTKTLWQSFDHPTDTVLPEQALTGKMLFANISQTNSSEGEFYLNITSNSFDAVERSSNKTYYTTTNDESMDRVKVKNGVLLSLKQERTGTVNMMLWRLEIDGHLRSYEWSGNEGTWNDKGDKLNFDSGDCEYPTVCGEYGLCASGKCVGCLEGKVDHVGTAPYFTLKDGEKLENGCSEVTPLSSCKTEIQQQQQQLIRFEKISYYGYNADTDEVKNITDLETCKEKCSTDCQCRGAFFWQSNTNNQYSMNGRCFLTSSMPSVFRISGEKYNSTAFIKVQLQVQSSTRGRRKVIGYTVGFSFCTVLVVLLVVLIWRKRKREAKLRRRFEEDELELSSIRGMPRRFSYRELKDATSKFSKKLGEGGFGAVFEGTLLNGTKVAVKVLGYKGQGKKEFVAEVETIGSIHHLNLVRLMGYCAEKLHRLLVYEFMGKGSLENWIFHKKENPVLGWNVKLKIIHDVAKALSYLHEECTHRIIHLDIKPQNILLDDNFKAKVSDFGLAKLLDRDQSQVFTTLRGTPGYLAPEWLSSIITEKVDVYSFGVVLLEIISGQRSLDHSRASTSISLVNMLKKHEEEDNVTCLIDRNCRDMDYCEEIAMKMLRLAIWCLQGDPNSRPSMSTVVKVLEGVKDVEPSSTMNFHPPSLFMGESSSSEEQLSWIVSGPKDDTQNV